MVTVWKCPKCGEVLPYDSDAQKLLVDLLLLLKKRGALTPLFEAIGLGDVTDWIEDNTDLEGP